MSTERIEGKNYSRSSMRDVVLDSAGSRLIGSTRDERDSVFADYEAYCLFKKAGVFNNLSQIRVHLNGLSTSVGSKIRTLRGDDFLRGAVMSFRSLGEYADSSLLEFMELKTGSVLNKSNAAIVDEIDEIGRIGYVQLDQSVKGRIDTTLSDIVDNNIEGFDIKTGYGYVNGLEYIFEMGFKNSVLDALRKHRRSNVEGYNYIGDDITSDPEPDVV